MLRTIAVPRLKSSQPRRSGRISTFAFTNRRLTSLLATALAVATFAALSPPARAEDTGPPGKPLETAQERYLADYPKMDALVGKDVSRDIFLRLADDISNRTIDVPEGYTEADWKETVATTERLDLDTIGQMFSGSLDALASRSGLHEFFVKSKADGTMQPIAVYEPPNLDTTKPAPVVVLLHGHDQSEVEILSQPFVRRLADETGTVVVAPYGRGLYDYAEPAATDVYDELDAALTTLPVDRHRTYLVGYSMGAFSVYMIGPRGGKRWAAVMAISGAILNSNAPSVIDAWQSVPIYVVTGAKDLSIPPKYGEQTAAYLASVGLPVSFYELPNGAHQIRTLMPVLEHAWLDMHRGTVREGSAPRTFNTSIPQDAPPMRRAT